MRLDRIKALRWQGRSLPDDVKNNLSTAELQVCFDVTCPVIFACSALSAPQLLLKQRQATSLLLA